MKTEEENPEGLHLRYHISKISGEPIDENAEYFILRLDSNGDTEHVKACREAINTYANVIETIQPKLSEDLKNRYPVND